MEWLLELNRSLDYIEEQLEGNMQLEQIAGEAAKIARCSAYHYQRIFSYLAGMTLSEYLRRRRMTLAAGHLEKRCWIPRFSMDMILRLRLIGHFRQFMELHHPRQKKRVLC